MAALLKSSLGAALAVAVLGCDGDRHSRQSVTIELAPPRPYQAEPGFSLATELPEANGSAPLAEKKADAGSSPG